MRSSPADTAAAADAPYVESIRGVDLLVHECNFPDSSAALAAQTGHSVTSAVLQVAAAAGVGQLVLVHVDPLADADDPLDLERLRGIFPRTILGRDRLEIEW